MKIASTSLNDSFNPFSTINDKARQSFKNAHLLRKIMSIAAVVLLGCTILGIPFCTPVFRLLLNVKHVKQSSAPVQNVSNQVNHTANRAKPVLQAAAPVLSTKHAAPATPQYSKAKKFSLSNYEREELYRTAVVRNPHNQYEAWPDAGGAANVVHGIKKDAKCGVMICANSGLPGGDVGKKGFAEAATLNVRTQEESILANVLITKFKYDKQKHKQFLTQSFDGVWGMTDGHTGTSTKTHQGIDFTTTENAEDYNQTYILPNCQLSEVDYSYDFKSLKSGSPKDVTLFFADSVNANPKTGTPTGTMKRTLNKKAVDDYGFFRLCIKTKLRSALDAMVSEGVTHALVGQLSLGIYAGKHQTDIRDDFKNILQEVLDEEVGPNGEMRKRYFDKVIVPTIPSK